VQQKQNTTFLKHNTATSSIASSLVDDHSFSSSWGEDGDRRIKYDTVDCNAVLLLICQSADFVSMQ